jgi:Tol biopolymer transport system component
MEKIIFGICLVLLSAGVAWSHSERFHLHPYPLYKNGLWKSSPSISRAFQKEVHLKNARPITDSGTNAEAYWSFDGKRLSFQAIRDSLAETHPCDQIYIMNADGSDIQLVSTGEGRDTCSFFTPDGGSVIYSSTQSATESWCPPTPDMSYGYLWPLYKNMNVFSVKLSDMSLVRLTHHEGYNAESVISPDGSTIIFTSDRDGDLELYTMSLDGGSVRRITYTPGYDGGAWFSHNNKMITWRANRPRGDNLTDYLNLLNLGLVEPSGMQIYIANADGTNAVQLTNNNAVNFAPAFLPDDSGVIFASNLDNPMEFHLYTVDLEGNNLTRITFEGSFNSFPMFSPDGKTLAWESNRNTTSYTDINVYLATWVN